MRQACVSLAGPSLPLASRDDPAEQARKQILQPPTTADIRTWRPLLRTSPNGHYVAYKPCFQFTRCFCGCRGLCVAVSPILGRRALGFMQEQESINERLKYVNQILGKDLVQLKEMARGGKAVCSGKGVFRGTACTCKAPSPHTGQTPDKQRLMCQTALKDACVRIPTASIYRGK